MRRLLYFDGLEISVKSEENQVLDNIGRDFSYFKNRVVINKDVSISITAEKRTPDYSCIDKPYFFTHLDGKCFGWGDIRYVRYPGALCFFNNKENFGYVVSESVVLLHQYVFFMMISKIGEYYDLSGKHRFHAFGIAYKNTGIFFAAPSGGGKTTLGLGLIQDSNFSFYSEDTPLINQNDRNRIVIHSFPLRLALRLDNSALIPSKFTRTINVPKFGTKKLIDIEYIESQRIEKTPKEVKIVFLLRKGIKRGKNESLKPVVRRKKKIIFFIYLLNHFVKGVDFPQRMEYLLTLSFYNGILKLFRIFLSRLKTACHLLGQVEPYVLYMSRNNEKNIEYIKKFVQCVKKIDFKSARTDCKYINLQ
ncbi:hypothetical protein H8E88_00765 [candidate division KSB1 bacterium]|nr:hypothetical protein [candidate division KSB1 bacterium]